MLAALVAAIATLAFADVAIAATSAASLTPPATIEVARRFPANDPNGVIVRVDTVDFRTYCARVLSHEWAPPSAFSDQALQAGALAVKAYAWYWATRPTKLPDVAAWGADVDDTTNYQVYMDWDYGQRYHDAVDATWSTALTRGGAVFQASYYAGAYNGGATDGYHMTQWGSQYWADQGKDHRWILAYYYPGMQLVSQSGAAASTSAPAAATTTPWTGPAAPAGAAALRLIGPITVAGDMHKVGDKVDATLTVRNGGRERGAWRVTLVGRGPGDEVRDFGSVGVKLASGAYRMLTFHRTVDLGGTWHLWLVADQGGSLSLVGADGGLVKLKVTGHQVEDGATASAPATPAAAAVAPAAAPLRAPSAPRAYLRRQAALTR